MSRPNKRILPTQLFESENGSIFIPYAPYNMDEVLFRKILEDQLQIGKISAVQLTKYETYTHATVYFQEWYDSNDSWWIRECIDTEGEYKHSFVDDLSQEQHVLRLLVNTRPEVQQAVHPIDSIIADLAARVKELILRVDAHEFVISDLTEKMQELLEPASRYSDKTPRMHISELM